MAEHKKPLGRVRPTSNSLSTDNIKFWLLLRKPQAIQHKNNYILKF